MCSPPQKKKNLSSLDDPKRKESNLFLPVFPRANIFSRDMSTLKLRVCRLFYFLLPFQFTKNYLLSLNLTRSHFDQARILLVNHMAF